MVYTHITCWKWYGNNMASFPLIYYVTLRSLSMQKEVLRGANSTLLSYCKRILNIYSLILILISRKMQVLLSCPRHFTKK